MDRPPTTFPGDLSESSAPRPLEAAWSAIERDVSSGLGGLSETLRRALSLELPAELQGELLTAKASADAIAARLADLGELARLTGTGAALDVATFDPLAVAERVAVDVAPVAWARQIELAVVPDGDLPARAHGAERVLASALRPIVEGALDGARPGRIEIAVRHDPRTHAWTFSVRGGAAPAMRVPRRGARALTARLLEARVAVLGARLERNRGEDVARHLHVTFGAMRGGEPVRARLLADSDVAIVAASAASARTTTAIAAAVGADARVIDITAERSAMGRETILLVDGERWSAARAWLAGAEGPQPITVWLAASSQPPDPAAFAALGADLWLTRPLDRARLAGALSLAASCRAPAPLPVTRPLAPRRALRRVLVAHGHLVQQAELAAHLEAAGMVVAVADDVAGMFRALSRDPFDIVVVDRELDGLALDRLAAEIGRRPATVLAVVVGDDSGPLHAPLERLAADGAGALARELLRLIERSASEDVAMDDNTDKLLDPAVVASLRELDEPGQPGLFEELVDLFLADAPPRVDALERALASGDAEALERVAHSLKSSCGNLGAASLADVCKKLEQHGRERRLEGVASLVARSRQLLREVQRALEAELGR